MMASRALIFRAGTAELLLAGRKWRLRRVCNRHQDAECRAVFHRKTTLPNRPSGPHAARLKRRKRHLLAKLGIPADALPGWLVLTHRRCGKAACHCAHGAGHPLCLLTFMVDGKKRVESIPADWIDAVRPAAEAGRTLKDAVAELFAIHAQLLMLERNQRRRPRPGAPSSSGRLP